MKDIAIFINILSLYERISLVKLLCLWEMQCLSLIAAIVCECVHEPQQTVRPPLDTEVKSIYNDRK